MMVVAIALAIGSTIDASAQEQTGSIEGMVRDQLGGILPGASVVVKNLAVGAGLDVVADQRGAFRFAALGPGFYDVTASLDGFKPARFERVEVLLGQIKRLDFALSVGGLAETVDVTAASPLVDVKQNARGFSLRQEQLEYLPRGVDYTSVVQFMPGANAEPKLGGLSMDGGSAPENRFIIDGVETSNPMTGLPGQGVSGLASLSVDSVEEVQVKSSGYSAEYGGTTGGVVNVLTRSGTNQWHGDARFYFGGDALDASPRPNLRRSLTVVNQAEYFTYPEDPYTGVQPGFSVGGPIHRDVSWFFLSYQPGLRHTERTVTFTLDKSTVTESRDEVQHMFTASQTLQLGPRLRTRFSANGAPARYEGVLPAQAGTDSPVSNFDVNGTLPFWTMSGSVDWVAAPKVFISGRVGYMYLNYHTDNVRSTPLFSFPITNIGLLDVPPELQRVTGFRTDTTNYNYVKDVLSRLMTQVDATWYVHAWGEHALKAGIQAEWLTNETNKGQNANVVSLAWNRAFQGKRGKYGYYALSSNPLHPRQGQGRFGTAQGSTAGLFLQDAWKIGAKLTVNLGLRTEHEDVPGYSADGSDIPPILTFGFGQKLAPRLGAAYDLRGDGRWKLYGSWGIFYDVFKYSLSSAFGGIQASSYSFTLDTYDWPTLLNDTACPPACPGTLINQTLISVNSEVPFDPNLEPMRSQEAVVGIEHQLKPNLLLTGRYVHKQLDRAVDDIGALDADNNEVYTIGNPGYGVAEYAYPGVRLPKAVRDYDAVEMGARRPMTRGWAFSLSYLWSRLYGNYSGLSQSDENGRVAPNVGRVYDNAFVMFDEKARPVLGPLATDRPHQFKGMVIYETPFHLSAGVFQVVGSGLPVTREVAVVQGSNFPVMYRGRLSDGRTPTLSQTDVYVQQQLAVWRGTRLAIGLSVSNLFNQNATISKYSTETEASYAIDVTEEDFFAGRFDVKQSMAKQGINVDARFLLPNVYQPPRTARVMLRWIF
jgi:hypothetical protein